MVRDACVLVSSIYLLTVAIVSVAARQLRQKQVFIVSRLVSYF